MIPDTLKPIHQQLERNSLSINVDEYLNFVEGIKQNTKKDSANLLLNSLDLAEQFYDIRKYALRSPSWLA